MKITRNRGYTALNRITVQGDIAVIHILGTGNIEWSESLIDAEDVEKVRDFRWTADFKDSYAYTTVKKQKIFLHQMIKGIRPKLMLDHINRNKLDNRKINLRHVTRSMNTFNTPVRSDSKSGFRGIYKRGKAFRAVLRGGGKVLLSKDCRSLEEAIKARREAELKYYGEYSTQPLS